MTVRTSRLNALLGSAEQRKPCVVCGATQFRKLFSARDFDSGIETFDLTQCCKCHLVRTEPPLADVQLARYYPSSYYGGGEMKFIRPLEWLNDHLHRRRAQSFLARLSVQSTACPNERPRILDIGCGRGSLLRMLDQLGCECHGVERAELPVDQPGDRIRIYREELPAIGFGADYFDMVVAWHSLEHMVDPAATIREIARILRPGGLLVVTVPNFASVQSMIFRGDWFHLDLPRHTHHFSPQTLQQCLSQGGFSVLSVATCSIEQDVYGFVQSILNKMLPFMRANALYGLLKKHVSPIRRLAVLPWLVLVLLLFPAALVEYGLAAILHRGATLTMWAERR